MVADVAAAIGSANESPSSELRAWLHRSSRFIMQFYSNFPHLRRLHYYEPIFSRPRRKYAFCPFKLSAYYMYIARATHQAAKLDFTLDRVSLEPVDT